MYPHAQTHRHTYAHTHAHTPSHSQTVISRPPSWFDKCLWSTITRGSKASLSNQTKGRGKPSWGGAFWEKRTHSGERL